MGHYPAAGPRLTFNITPYLWLPQVDATLKYPLPAGLGGSTTLDFNPSGYLTHLNFAAMLAAEARYDRFSLITDFIYVNANNGNSRFTSVDIAAVPQNPISSTVGTSASMRLQSIVWTFGGGYTVAEGAWGNVDVLGGLRMLWLNSTSNYSLSVQFFGPQGNAGPSFGGIGSLSASDAIWNGIIGLRGRVLLGASGFFLPYYVDVGGGGSSPTWQIYSGVGYQTGWAGVSLGYRYLSFHQGSSALIQNLSFGGLYLAGNFRF